MAHLWLLAVLQDLAGYCRQNDLPLLAEEIDALAERACKAMTELPPEATPEASQAKSRKSSAKGKNAAPRKSEG